MFELSLSHTRGPKNRFQRLKLMKSELDIRGPSSAGCLQCLTRRAPRSIRRCVRVNSVQRIEDINKGHTVP
jgi:hypothetical protein